VINDCRSTNSEEQFLQQRLSGQSSLSEQMAFLMEMMSPRTTGHATGAESRAQYGGRYGQICGSVAAANDRSGSRGVREMVNKSSGLPQNYPTEFRQALESYFKALKRIKMNRFRNATPVPDMSWRFHEPRGRKYRRARRRLACQVDKIYLKGLNYLAKNQSAEGHWKEMPYGSEPAVVGLSIIADAGSR